MNIAFPFDFDARGQTAPCDENAHIRQMIELLLFTSPGERVNRPDFGCGILGLVFEPNSPEIAAALQFTVDAALERWLGDLIDVRELRITSIDSSLNIVLRYVVRRTGDDQTTKFERKSP